MTDKMDFREISDIEEERKTEIVDIPEDIDDSDDGYERYCFMCHRPESKVGKLIDMPNNMSICSDCMQKSMDAMSNMPPIDFSNMGGGFLSDTKKAPANAEAFSYGIRQ